jgi:hypothetical protein
LNGWEELDQIRFIARLGVRPPSGDFTAKNTILEVITPERQGWTKLEQIAPSAKATNGNAAQPANAIARPQWAS